MNNLPSNAKRKVIIRTEAESDKRYGCKPDERPTEMLFHYGIVNINKPQGPSSHQISDYVKKILNVEKAGHSGTLDPNVTGVLPIALGRSTKIVMALLKAGKEYVGIMNLHREIDRDKIIRAVEKFKGQIEQIPPVKSAVRREKRKRTIYYFELIETDGRDVLFRVGCEAGTYMRKLIHDLGQELKCGAHMAQLIRTRAGPFDIFSSINLHELTDAYFLYKEKGDDSLLRKSIYPIESAVEHLPKIWIDDSAVDSICHGAMLNIPGVVKIESEIEKEDLIAIMTLKNELVSLGIAMMTSEEIMKADKGLAVKTYKVLMPRKTYPKFNASA